MDAVLIGKIAWCAGVVLWFVIRWPHARRSRRTPVSRQVYRTRERVLLAIGTLGLGVIPALYVFVGAFRFADRPQPVWLMILGIGVFVFALWLFRQTHKQLGRNWSVTLEVRETHSLITDGVYRYVRHPMYSAFWLWAVAQALLLPNWIAGLAGLVGFGTLYTLRVTLEENMMREAFGQQYEAYAKRTGRVLPRLFRSSAL